MDKIAELRFKYFVKECWRPDIFVDHLTRVFGNIAKEYTYIVLGKAGPTGKSYVASELRSRGFSAFEITEDIMYLVDYTDDRNHYIVNDSNKTVILVLNSRVEL